MSGTKSRTVRLDACGAVDTAIDLYWIPLGAGGHSVRFNGIVYESSPRRSSADPAPHLPLGPRAEDARRRLHSRDGARSKLSWRGARRGGGGPGWHQVGGTTSDLPLRGPAVEGRRHPRPGLRRVTSGASHRRRESCRASLRTCPRGAGIDVGPGRVARRGDVELQLDHLLGAHPRRARSRGDPPACRRSSSGLGCPHHNRPTR